MGKRRKRKSLKKRLREKALWFTIFCSVVSLISLAGIVWIIRDTYLYQYTIQTVEGSFDYYEEINDRVYVPTVGFRSKRQGNIYIDGTKYVIASDSLITFDAETFQRNVASGDKIIVQVTDDNVIYSLADSNKIQYLYLHEAQTKAREDNAGGIVLCIIMPILLWLAWYASDYGNR